MIQKQKCLAVGAGAIGKSVSAVTFSKFGCDVLVADVKPEVIADINNRNGYCIIQTEFNKPDVNVAVEGIRAAEISSEEAKNFAMEADYICTAIGPVGMKFFLPTLMEWLKARNRVSKKPLYLLFFENDSSCVSLFHQVATEALGAVPEWMKVAKASIERMTKPLPPVDGKYDVVAESVFPVLLPKAALRDSSIADSPLFALVDDVDAYYYRKLYTNNLGHAVLGYVGSYYGYATADQCVKDAKVCAILDEVLSETGEMLIKEYGFTAEEMQAHLKLLPTRYWNQGLNDSLDRLARDPVRKLSPSERIVGAIRKCSHAGIRPDGIIKVLCYAVRYNGQDDQSLQLAKDFSEKGMGWILENICGISSDEKLYDTIMEIDKQLFC